MHTLDDFRSQQPALLRDAKEASSLLSVDCMHGLLLLAARLCSKADDLMRLSSRSGKQHAEEGVISAMSVRRGWKST